MMIAIGILAVVALAVSLWFRARLAFHTGFASKAAKWAYPVLLLGIGVALTAAALLWFDVIPPSVASIAGIVGIGLITTSNSLRAKKS